MQKNNNFPIFTPITCDGLGMEIKLIRMVGLFSASLDQSTQSYIRLALTDNHLLYFQRLDTSSPTYYCNLNFEFKFEILRETPWKVNIITMKDDQTPGNPFGIKFEKQLPNKKYETFEVYSMDLNLIYLWKQFLETKINQRGFHKLFKSKKQIGRGAFASVYLAQRLEDKKMVAVKAFSKQKQFQPLQGKQSLINEITLMRKFNHQNIIHLYGVYETENSVYVILEYLEGRQLYNRLKNNEIKDIKDVMEVIKNILEGIKALAEKRIIHRDLKPENILFKRQGVNDLAICDFGLATYAEEEKYLFVRCGTPGYVAPEIINIKNMSTKSDPISDVFSAGLIFHYLLLGASIFEGKKYEDILKQNRACSFNFEKEIYRGVDPIALDLLKKLLEVNPFTRINASDALSHPFFKYQVKEFHTIKRSEAMIDEKQQDLSTVMGSKQIVKMVQSPSNLNKILLTKDRRSSFMDHRFCHKENQILQQFIIKKKTILQSQTEKQPRRRKLCSTHQKNGLIAKLRS